MIKDKSLASNDTDDIILVTFLQMFNVERMEINHFFSRDLPKVIKTHNILYYFDNEILKQDKSEIRYSFTANAQKDLLK